MPSVLFLFDVNTTDSRVSGASIIDNAVGAELRKAVASFLDREIGLVQLMGLQDSGSGLMVILRANEGPNELAARRLLAQHSNQQQPSRGLRQLQPSMSDGVIIRVVMTTWALDDRGRQTFDVTAAQQTIYNVTRMLANNAQMAELGRVLAWATGAPPSAVSVSACPGCTVNMIVPPLDTVTAAKASNEMPGWLIFFLVVFCVVVAWILWCVFGAQLKAFGTRCKERPACDTVLRAARRVIAKVQGTDGPTWHWNPKPLARAKSGHGFTEAHNATHTRIHDMLGAARDEMSGASMAGSHMAPIQMAAGHMAASVVAAPVHMDMASSVVVHGTVAEHPMITNPMAVAQQQARGGAPAGGGAQAGGGPKAGGGRANAGAKPSAAAAAAVVQKPQADKKPALEPDKVKWNERYFTFQGSYSDSHW